MGRHPMRATWTMDLAGDEECGEKALVRKGQSTELGGSWTGRDRLTLCPIRVHFDGRMLCPWDVGNQQVLSVVTSPGHWLLLTLLSNTMVSLRRCLNSRRLSQQGQEAARKLLWEIQIPDLLILRSSYHRKEEETMKLAFPASILIHCGEQPGLAGLRLFLPSDFRDGQLRFPVV